MSSEPVTYVLVPDNIPTIALDTGVEESVWHAMYLKDQAFGFTTKVVVVTREGAPLSHYGVGPELRGK